MHDVTFLPVSYKIHNFAVCQINEIRDCTLYYFMKQIQHLPCLCTIVKIIRSITFTTSHILSHYTRTESITTALINRGCKHLSLTVTKHFTMYRAGRALWRGCTRSSSTSTTKTGFHYHSAVKYFLSQHLDCNWTRCQAAPRRVDRGHIVWLAIIRNERGLRTTVGGNDLCNCLK